MTFPSQRYHVRVVASLLLVWGFVVVHAIAQPAPASPPAVEAPTVDAPTVESPASPSSTVSSHVDDDPAGAPVAGLPHGEDPPDSDATVAAPSDSAARRAVDEPSAIDSLHDVEFPRLAPSEYRYGGAPRYTMHGKMPYRETHISPVTLGTFGGALLGLAGGITWYQQAWYPDSTKAPFHFQTDWGYSKQFDKAGHMFGGWMSSYCSYEAFIASGLSPDDAALWGSLGGLFFQTMMEVQDGFFSYGFDPTDAISNAIGSAYFYAQQKIPELQYFNPKWTVGPNPRDSAREASQIRSRLIVDDYDRQDVWLSAKVHYLLPESMQEYWPKWLCVAVGAGARDVELLNGYQPYRVVHFALDYDLVEMLPDLGSFGNWLVQGLNSFKLLPAPALQVWPHVEFKLLYPFTL